MEIKEQIATIERTLNNNSVGESIKKSLRVKLKSLKDEQSTKTDPKSQSDADIPYPSQTAIIEEDDILDGIRTIISREFDEDRGTWKYTLDNDSKIYHNQIEEGVKSGKYKVRSGATTPKDMSKEKRPNKMIQLKRWLKDRLKQYIYRVEQGKKEPFQVAKMISKVQTNDFQLEDVVSGKKTWAEFGKAKDLVINEDGFKVKGDIVFMYDKTEDPEKINAFLETIKIVEKKSKKNTKSKPKVQKTVFIEYMNKDIGFKADKKYFETVEDAKKWAVKNFEKFNMDMIRHVYPEDNTTSEDYVMIDGEMVDCSDLIAEEREKIEKRRNKAKKYAKKPDSQKNIARIKKATESIEDSIKERLKEGKSLSKSEIDSLISECQDLVKKLKKYLKEIQK